MNTLVHVKDALYRGLVSSLDRGPGRQGLLWVRQLPASSASVSSFVKMQLPTEAFGGNEIKNYALKVLGEGDTNTQINNYYHKDKTMEHLEALECYKKENGIPGKVEYPPRTT